MNRFNLTFKGDILPGLELERVKVSFGKLLGIHDRAHIDHFFSGEPCVLQHNLDRKAASTLYLRFQKIGADVFLEKAVAPEIQRSTGPAPSRQSHTTPPSAVVKKTSMETPDRQKKLIVSATSTPPAKGKRPARLGKTFKDLQIPTKNVSGVQPSAVPEEYNKEGRDSEPGAPNFFSLRPFRNSIEVQGRVERSWQIMHIAFTISALAAIAFIILGGGFLLLSAPSQHLTGAQALAVDQRSNLLITAGNRLFMHDRAGLGSVSYELDALGLDTLSAPIAFVANNEILLQGRPLDTDQESLPQRLMHCNLENTSCHPLTPQRLAGPVEGLVVDARTGAVFAAIPAAGLLLKLSLEGDIIGRSETDMPLQTVLRLQSGLLHMNSADGPAISIFKPDSNGFGRQLDEILLLPPVAQNAGQTRVGDFVWAADRWWVVLFNPDTSDYDLYQFDSRWNFIKRIDLAPGSLPKQLVNWADKTLVVDTKHLQIQRFNAQGEAEVPLVSDYLADYVRAQNNAASLSTALWHINFAVLLVIIIAGLIVGYAHRLRSMVYRLTREHNAKSVEDQQDIISWIDLSANRRQRLTTIGIIYAAAGVIILAIIWALGVSSLQVLALFIGLSGPAIALMLLAAANTGHIGLLNDQLLLVDHNNIYNLGSGPRIHFRERFLMMDDVVVFVGTPLLPAFAEQQLRQRVAQRVLAGIKVDRKTVLIKLINGGHPLVQGAIATATTVLTAMLILLITATSV